MHMKYLEVNSLEKIVPEKLLDNDIIKKVKKKKLVSRYIMMIIALLISALVFNIFIVPTNIVAGGVNGISIITKYIYGWDPSIVMFVVSFILLIFSLMYLGVERTSGTVVATFLYPIFVELTSHITEY